jgi:cobalt-zinc-cadmium efflux system membrane fusion protein
MQRGLAVRALRLTRWLILGFAVALIPGQARADNDYYDNVQGGAAAKSAMPRLALQNGDVELVAVAQGKQLVIYLDRFEDGTPIDGADIEVTTGEETLRAAPVKNGVYVVGADWAATPGPYKLSFAATGEQLSATLAGTLVVTPPKADTGEAATDDNNDDNNSSSSSSSPLTIAVPFDVAVSLGLGVLAVLGLSAVAAFRRPAAVVAVAGTAPRSRLAAGPGRWIAVMLAAGFIISLLIVGGSVLARKGGSQQGGVVGLLH